MASGRPLASIAKSTPPDSAAWSSATRSSRAASRVCVAPIRRASSSFAGFSSTAMIGVQPAIDAPATAQRPMPPVPKTARL